jgi:alanyl-tRNA synthetase
VVQADPCIIFIALISKGQGIRVVVFVGKKARERIKADYIAKMLSTHLGGSGGGDDKFAQGGGRYGERIKDALLLAEGLILKNVG